MKIQKSITLDQRQWSKIDKIRGNVPRSAFLQKLVDNALGNTRRGRKQ